MPVLFSDDVYDDDDDSDDDGEDDDGNQYLTVSMPVLFSDDDGGEYEINDVNDDSLSIYIKKNWKVFLILNICIYNYV